MGCAPHRPPSPTVIPPAYRAAGTFHYQTPQKGVRGMWDLLYMGEKGYRLALYSSLGTLEGCLAYKERAFSSCGGQVSPPEVLEFLPASLLARLPLILLGHPPGGEVSRNPKGQIVRARLLVKGEPWTISYDHYLKAENVAYPTQVIIKGPKETLKVRIEEMTPGWTPSPG